MAATIPFPKTMSGLEEVYKLLRCVKCGELPKEKIFMLGCEHKYCESCVVKVAGNSCLICDHWSMAKNAIPDLFTTNLLTEIKVLEKTLMKEIHERQVGQPTLSDDSPSKKEPTKKKNKMMEAVGEKLNFPLNMNNKSTCFDKVPAGEKLATEQQKQRFEDKEVNDEEELLSLDFKDEPSTTTLLKEKENKELLCVSKLNSRINQIVSKNETNDNEKKIKQTPYLRHMSRLCKDVVEKGTKRQADKEVHTSVKRKAAEKKPSKKGKIDFNKDSSKSKNDSDVDMFDFQDEEDPESPPSLTPHTKTKVTLEHDDDDDEDFKSKKSSIKSSKVGSIGNINGRGTTFRQKNSKGNKGKVENESKDTSPSPPPLTPYGNIDKRNMDNSFSTVTRRSSRSLINSKDELLKTTIDNMKETPKKPASKLSKRSLQPPRRTSPDITEKITTTARSNKGSRGRHTSAASSASSNTSPSFLNVSSSSALAVDKKNPKGETPLHVACRNGLLEKVKQLIEMGADLNAQDNAGWTPLHEAINGKSKNKLELVILLCEHKCNPNIPGGEVENEFALHEAARAGLDEVVECLLSHSASPNVKNSMKKLPRDVASKASIREIFDNAAGKKSEERDDDSSDPIVLKLQFSKALLYVCFDASPDYLGSIEENFKLKLSNSLRGEVTHMIFPSKEQNDSTKVPFSLEYLHGIVHGTWMLRKKWMDDCLSKKELLSPKEYEIQGCLAMTEVNDAPPAHARLNKESGNPGLLNGLTFYFNKNCSYENISKKELVKLIISAEGTVINREPNPDSVDPFESPIRFHAKDNNHKLVLTSHIILYEESNEPPEEKKYNMEHVKTLKVKWLIDSIGNFSLLDPDKYL